MNRLNRLLSAEMIKYMIFFFERKFKIQFFFRALRQVRRNDNSAIIINHADFLCTSSYEVGCQKNVMKIKAKVNKAVISLLDHDQHTASSV